jgi:transcriptional regulator GlxA family with amidase domain
MSAKPNTASPARFGFLLLDEFTLISLSSAIEPLRMANRVCEQDHYGWTILSESGLSVTASDGLSVNVGDSIENRQLFRHLDAVIVCGGLNVEEHVSPALVRWLRAAAEKKLALGALCTGTYALAKAGLLDGYRCTTHWENMAALNNQFPNTVVSRSVFSIDRDRYTCSGGTTPVDMMLHFITERCGNSVSAAVAEQFMYERIRRADDQQRVPLKHIVGHHSNNLVLAVEFMEANIREPISLDELAGFVGLSSRQLQRLFHRYLQCTPSHYYLQLRLQRARELLRQTRMSLTEVAELTGFISTTQLSRNYKNLFGTTPAKEHPLIRRTPSGRAASMATNS